MKEYSMESVTKYSETKDRIHLGNASHEENHITTISSSQIRSYLRQTLVKWGYGRHTSRYRNLRCSECRKILQFLDTGQSSMRVDIELFRSGNHETCLQLLRSLFSKPIEHSSTVRLVRERDGTFSFDYLGIATLQRTKVLVSSADPNFHHRLTGRSLEMLKETQLLRHWISVCFQQHGAKCCNPLNVNYRDPSFLIDVSSKSLVPGKGKGNYVALSYRWSRAACFQSTRDQIPLLRKEMSLASDELLDQIPTTIKDAMSIVQDLGHRFLWVDALCIVQDDEETKSHDIHNMAAIYAHAAFTIIAGDGDSTSGLKEIRQLRPWQREGQQQAPSSWVTSGKSVPFYGYTLSRTEFSCLEETKIESEYTRRGWTFQEYHTSARRLIFYENMWHWECTCAIWHEDRIPIIEIKRPWESSPLKRILNGLPSMLDYALVVNSFNTRRFTYKRDTLPAFSGILTALSKTFTSGFIYGMPEMYFDMSLLWTIRSSEMGGHLIGRRTTDAGDFSFPSWTWLSWQGDMMFDNDILPDQQNGLQRIFPITRWYSHSTLDGNARRPIRSTWYEKRKMFDDPRQPSPPGWTRCEALSNSVNRYYFNHPSTGNSFFQYPISRDVEEENGHPTDSLASYISCRTERATVYVEEVMNSKILLKDMQGVVLGHIRGSHGDLQSSNGTVLPQGTPLEVVAIAGCIKVNGGDIQGEAEYLYIMWVHSVNGIAYRLGLGEVRRDYWEAQIPSPETSDIILG